MKTKQKHNLNDYHGLFVQIPNELNRELEVVVKKMV